MVDRLIFLEKTNHVPNLDHNQMFILSFFIPK